MSSSSNIKLGPANHSNYAQKPKSFIASYNKNPSLIYENDERQQNQNYQLLQRESKNLKQQISILQSQLRIQREKNKKLENKYSQLQVENQDLKSQLQKAMKGKNDFQVQDQNLNPYSPKNSKKSKLSLSKHLPPQEKEEQKKDYEVCIDKALAKLKQQGKLQSKDNLIYRQAEAELLKAENAIESKKDKSAKQFQALAFIYTTLTNIKCSQSIKISQIQEVAKKALSIYNSKEGLYFEQKIVLLNNLGLHYQKTGDFDSALEVYQQIQKIQQIYYGLNDQRKTLILNNIACAYCEKQMGKEGLAYFNKCLKLVVKGSQSQQLVNDNMKYYRVERFSTKNLPYSGDKFENWLSKSPKYKK